MVWKPEVTVAAVVESNGKFLLVEEHTTEGIRLNQPAGHLEAGESLSAAVSRETLEETAHEFVPKQLTGIYRWSKPDSDRAIPVTVREITDRHGIPGPFLVQILRTLRTAGTATK